MSTIDRSIGIPITHGQVFYGMAGGGYSGATADLDAVVQRAAELRTAYWQAQPIRAEVLATPET